MSKTWVSVREAARLLEVSHTTIHNWIEAGHLAATRIGPKIIRIEMSEIERLKTTDQSNDNSDGNPR